MGSHEPIVVDSNEAVWKHMKEKSADEFLGGDHDDTVFRGIGVASGFEGNSPV